MATSVSFMLRHRKNMLRRIKEIIIDIVFPMYCPGCNEFISSQNKILICQNCLKNIKIMRDFYCPKCIKRVVKKCSCRSNLNFFGFSVSYQDPSIRKLIFDFKYRFAKKLRNTLSYFLIEYLKNLIKNENIFEEDWIIIPIPLHRKRKNWRGFNQCLEISNIISKYFGLELLDDILIRIKETSPQAEIIHQKKREENIEKAFSIVNNQKIIGKNIVLIDDVRASGSTLETAAKELRNCGAKKIFGLVVAR